MKTLNEQEFKNYVVKKAKEYIFGTTDNLEKPAINENMDVTLDSVKAMIKDLRKMNSSLSFNDLTMDTTSLNESKEIPKRKKKTSVLKENKEIARPLKVAGYENSSIEMKGNLSETMNNYNNKKSRVSGKEDQTQSWNRLVDYKKFDEKS